jgi:hypothetical protein
MRTVKNKLLRLLLRSILEALRLSSAKFRYQPKTWTTNHKSLGNSDRVSEDRLRLIRPLLNSDDRNVVELGSNAGFFSIELGADGYRCHGVERDYDLIVYSTLTAYLRQVSHVSFECADLNLEFLESMQLYDVILNFSLMHHVILHRDLDYATRILTMLREKTKRVMFFEMGQSDEVAADWSGKLPAMAPNPEVWISNWLVESGFGSVTVVGGSEKRLIFAAYVHAD